MKLWVPVNVLDEFQNLLIESHLKVAARLWPQQFSGKAWSIVTKGNYFILEGDDFDMKDFLSRIKVPDCYVFIQEPSTTTK